MRKAKKSLGLLLLLLMMFGIVGFNNNEVVAGQNYPLENFEVFKGKFHNNYDDRKTHLISELVAFNFNEMINDDVESINSVLIKYQTCEEYHQSFWDKMWGRESGLCETLSSEKQVRLYDDDPIHNVVFDSDQVREYIYYYYEDLDPELLEGESSYYGDDPDWMGHLWRNWDFEEDGEMPYYFDGLYRVYQLEKSRTGSTNELFDLGFRNWKNLYAISNDENLERYGFNINHEENKISSTSSHFQNFLGDKWETKINESDLYNLYSFVFSPNKSEINTFEDFYNSTYNSSDLSYGTLYTILDYFIYNEGGYGLTYYEKDAMHGGSYDGSTMRTDYERLSKYDWYYIMPTDQTLYNVVISANVNMEGETEEWEMPINTTVKDDREGSLAPQGILDRIKQFFEDMGIGSLFSWFGENATLLTWIGIGLGGALILSIVAPFIFAIFKIISVFFIPLKWMFRSIGRGSKGKKSPFENRYQKRNPHNPPYYSKNKYKYKGKR